MSSGSQKILDITQDAILTNKDLNSIDTEIKGISQESFLDEPEVKLLLVEAWENSVKQALEDNVLTKQEEEKGLFGMPGAKLAKVRVSLVKKQEKA